MKANTTFRALTISGNQNHSELGVPNPNRVKSMTFFPFVKCYFIWVCVLLLNLQDRCCCCLSSSLLRSASALCCALQVLVLSTSRIPRSLHFTSHSCRALGCVTKINHNNKCNPLLGIKHNIGVRAEKGGTTSSNSNQHKREHQLDEPVLHSACCSAIAMVM